MPQSPCSASRSAGFDVHDVRLPSEQEPQLAATVRIADQTHVVCVGCGECRPLSQDLLIHRIVAPSKHTDLQALLREEAGRLGRKLRCSVPSASPTQQFRLVNITLLVTGWWFRCVAGAATRSKTPQLFMPVRSSHVASAVHGHLPPGSVCMPVMQGCTCLGLELTRQLADQLVAVCERLAALEQRYAHITPDRPETAEVATQHGHDDLAELVCRNCHHTQCVSRCPMQEGLCSPIPPPAHPPRPPRSRPAPVLALGQGPLPEANFARSPSFRVGAEVQRLQLAGHTNFAFLL